MTDRNAEANKSMRAENARKAARGMSDEMLQLQAERLRENVEWRNNEVERHALARDSDAAALAVVEAELAARAPIEVDLHVGEQVRVISAHGDFTHVESRIATVLGEPRLVCGNYKATLRRIS